MASSYRKSNYIAVIDDENQTLKSTNALKQIESKSLYPIKFLRYSKVKRDKTLLANAS